MILTDSSVWIDLFRNRDTEQVRRLEEYAADNAVIVGDLILCEVLRGARDEKAARRMAEMMRKFSVVSLGGEAVAIRAAANYRRLRLLGVTVDKTIDLLIAAYCIENDVPLLHADRDFEPMEKHLGLKAA